MSEITIAYIAAGVALVGLMTFFGVSAFFRVNSIVVEGAGIYTAEQVAEASGVSRGDNLVYLKLKNAENLVAAELTYISDVEVRREFPDTLIIKVAESTPLAYIPFAGDALIIDSSGRVLDIVKMNMGTPVTVGGSRLIQVLGVPIAEAVAGSTPTVVQGSETSFMAMSDILTAMERENVAPDVNYLDVANIINISFGYMDKYRIMLGGLSGSRHKIAGLPSYISQAQERYPNTGGVLNMSDPSGDYRFAPD